MTGEWQLHLVPPEGEGEPVAVRVSAPHDSPSHYLCDSEGNMLEGEALAAVVALVKRSQEARRLAFRSSIHSDPVTASQRALEVVDFLMGHDQVEPEPFPGLAEALGADEVIDVSGLSTQEITNLYCERQAALREGRTPPTVPSVRDGDVWPS